MHAYPAGGATGDDNAFTALCEQHRARLVAFCTRRLGTRHDAEDAAHEALLRAHRALPRFDASDDAWPWLRTIAARVCTDMQRKAARVMPAPALDRPTALDVHEQMAARVRAEIVGDALDRLAPRYRSPLVLRELGGWSNDDIARVQGRTRASVRSILSRSRRRLGDQVEEVARSQKQWPLPGGVPPLERLRARVHSWRADLERSSPAFASVIDFSSAATRWMIGAPAMASMFSVAGAASALLLPSPAAAPYSAASARLTAQLPATEQVRVDVQGSTVAHAAVAVTPLPRETFTRIDTTPPVQVNYAPALTTGGTAGVTGDDEQLYVTYDATLAVPGYGDLGGQFNTNVPCAWFDASKLACETARSLLRQSPTP